jgi:OOP family OmpA-OmpF porin
MTATLPLHQPFVADLDRYVQIGLKANLGPNSFEASLSSKDFSTRFYRADLQAAAN